MRMFMSKREQADVILVSHQDRSLGYYLVSLTSHLFLTALFPSQHPKPLFIQSPAVHTSKPPPPRLPICWGGTQTACLLYPSGMQRPLGFSTPRTQTLIHSI